MPLPHLSLQNLNAPADQYIACPDKYDLNPPYQRGSVWTPTQQINLLRSLFMGLPIGAIVVNFRGYGAEVMYAVVDGKQRIETLRAFAADQFAIPASWFPADAAPLATTTSDHVDGPAVLFSGLAPRYQRTVENFPIATLVAHVATIAAEAELFDLINSGGTAQTPADLARARDVATTP